MNNAYGKMYEYGTSGNVNNKIKLESKLTRQVVSKIVNSNCERQSDWLDGYTGYNTGDLYYSTTSPYFGLKSLKITVKEDIVESNNGNSAFTKYAYQNINLEKGKTYTLSSYIRTKQFSTNNNGGALIFAEYVAADGTTKRVQGELIKDVLEWNRYNLTFTLPTDAKSDIVKICLGIKAEIGEAYFDGIQLEEGETANTYNLLENSSFDNNFTSWNLYTDCDPSIDGYYHHYTENNMLRINGDANKTKEVYQQVQVSGKKGDILSLSSWVRTKSVQTDVDTKVDRVVLGICRTNGTFQWLIINVNPDSKNWQYLSDQVMADSDYSYVNVYCKYGKNANYSYYDNLCLFKDEFGQSYSYDKNGNLIATQDRAKQNSTLQYSGSNELLKETDAKGGSFIYEYDSKIKNRLLAATNNSKVTYAFTYDGYGNATSSTISNNDKVTTEISPTEIYYIKSKSSGLYLHVDLGGTTAGTKVNQYLYRNTTNLKWKFVSTGDGYYNIVPQNATSLTLDSNIAVGNYLQISNNIVGQSSDYQKFKLIKNTDGSFKIICKKNEADKVLTVLNDSKEAGSNLSEEKDENRESQYFYLESASEDADDPESKAVAESGEVFYIKSKVSSMYLDYVKDSNGNITEAPGTKLVQREFTGSDSQRWKITKKFNGSYKITPLFSNLGRSLDLSGGATYNGNQLNIYNYSESNSNQEWTLKKNADGTVYISPTKYSSSKNIEVQAGSTSENAPVTIYDSNGTDAQKWYLESANMVNIDSKANYRIKVKKSNLYVGVKNDLNQDGANVEQVAFNETSYGQKWTITKTVQGYYNITSCLDNNSTNTEVTSRVLEVAGGGTTNGTNVQIFASSQDSERAKIQQWEFVPVGDGSYYIKPRNASGIQTLDVAGGSTAAGANIQTWQAEKNTSQQQYILEKISGAESEYIQSKATYSDEGRFVKTVTDARGKGTTYEYNFDANTDKGTGTLKSVTDAKGNVTSYTYDNLKRMTSVIMNGTSYTNSYAYENDKLKKITHNGFNYEFAYDKFGNTQEIKVAGNKLVTNEYGTQNGTLNKTTYGNNQYTTFEYDRFERVTKKTSQNTAGTVYGSFYYTYDAKGNLASIRDSRDNSTTKYVYDLADRLVKTNQSNGFKVEYGYDTNSNINRVSNTLNGKTYTTNYFLDSDNKPTSVKIDTDKYLVYNYDRLSRLNDKTLKSGANSYTTSMKYVTDTTDKFKTTTLLESITNKKTTEAKEDKISYTYDNNGNIETISKNGVLKQKYYYDQINQLIREDNVETNQTTGYTYDIGGNILNKKTYAYTTASTLTGLTPTATKTYSYDTTWKDKLVNYNGKAITYDEIGNMKTYDGNTYTWQNGRQLASITATGKNIQYKYNDNGIRTQKTVNNVTTNYYLNGDKVIYEVTGTNQIYYTYDAEDNLIGFKYNDTQYYYVRNGQGDIIGILDNSLNNVISYTYDTWGKLLSIKNASGQDVTNDTTSIGYINQYRYRGYRYDNETSMYYLNSRYYNPDLCRFINADSIAGRMGNIIEHNMFAYCINDPINKSDETGHFWHIAIGAAIGAGISAATTISMQLATTGSVNWKSVGISALAGAASGALTATGIGAFGQLIGGTLISTAAYVADCKVNGSKIKKNELVATISLSVFSGALGGKGANSNGAITNTAKLAKKTIDREKNRANKEFAKKMTLNIKEYSNIRINSIANSAVIGFTLSGIFTSTGFYVSTDETFKDKVIKIFDK